jgi:hypothetical protein
VTYNIEETTIFLLFIDNLAWHRAKNQGEQSHFLCPSRVTSISQSDGYGSTFHNFKTDSSILSRTHMPISNNIMGFCHKSLRAIAPSHNRLFEKKTKIRKESRI